MKKLLLSFFCFAVLFSCKQSPTPKETAQTFLKSLLSADFTTASSLVSSETKVVLDKAQKEPTQLSSTVDAFQLNTLSETINGEKAEVKNDVLSLSMVKEKEGWKVVLNEDLLKRLQQQEELNAAAKAKWAALQTEYEARLKVAKAYVDYKKSTGALSPKVLLLTEMVYNFRTDSIHTKEALLSYLQKQQQLSRAIDEAIEPSQAANTDLSLQYILQISTAADRIKRAEAEYQAAAQKAYSPVYVPLPIEMASGVNVKQN
jgi:hypothetical protein